MKVLNEGDDTHLCFAFGALEWIDFVDAFYAGGPTTPTELSPVVALCLLL